MACKDDKIDVNNAFHGNKDENDTTITLNYGPYMNWGRWNHNANRIQPLIQRLLDNGINVQLKHDEKETSWNDHGWVKIFLGEKEQEELASSDDIQHNRNWHERVKAMLKLADECMEKLAKRDSKNKAVGNPIQEAA